MIHDPRFETIENCFIINKRSVFGGDTRQGIQMQLPDGTFTTSVTDLEQYSEILGEGRYFHGVVMAEAYAEAIDAMFPGRRFLSEQAIASEHGDIYPDITNGLKQQPQLNDVEKNDVSVESLTGC